MTTEKTTIQGRQRSSRGLQILIALVAFGSPVYGAGDIWVDAADGLDTNLGTQTSPKQTITAAMLVATAGDTIHVLEGTYDDAHGEDFPISFKDAIRMIGEETAQADWPRIGGDVNDSSVTALFEIMADTAHRNSIEIKNFYFKGEDSSGKDAPSAIHAELSGGQELGCTIENNYFERSEMYVSEGDGRPAIAIVSGHGEANVTIQQNTIYASRRGAIEHSIGTDTTADDTTKPFTKILNNDILLDGTDIAEFGIRLIGEGDIHSESGFGALIRLNQVDASGCTGSGGIKHGIEMRLELSGNGSFTYQQSKVDIIGNEVEGTLDHALYLKSHTTSEAAPHLSCFTVERNLLHDNAGNGLTLDWGMDSLDNGNGGYLNIATFGNVIADNNIGIRLEGLDDGAQGGSRFISDTIANNASGGFEILDEWEDSGMPPSWFGNLIVYDNGGTYQVSTAMGSTWTPQDAVDREVIEYCDWELVTSSLRTAFLDEEGNKSEDPGFEDPTNGDYHLKSTSTLIDAGDNNPDNGDTLTELDYDRDTRIIDGDNDSSAVVDMGADEYDPGS